jgi:hypothetical protein
MNGRGLFGFKRCRISGFIRKLQPQRASWATVQVGRTRRVIA